MAPPPWGSPQDSKAEYKAKALVLANARAKSKAKKTKGTASHTGRLPVLTDVDQKVARQYAPPGGYIWRNRFGGAWCSHFDPFRRFSASFERFGQEEALRLNYVDLWRSGVS